MSIKARKWSVRHSRLLESVYGILEELLVAAGILMRIVGTETQEKIITASERFLKSHLFDCQMCGACILNSTGMSCPMNCPKQLRNGPCGGVRSDGKCEVFSNMTCVWLDAWNGSRRMKNGDRILTFQPAMNFELKGRSAWIAIIVNHRQASSAQDSVPRIT